MQKKTFHICWYTFLNFLNLSNFDKLLIFEQTFLNKSLLFLQTFLILTNLSYLDKPLF